MKIGIIGLGLIGGSLGRSITKKTEHTVFALDINADTMLKGKLLGAYHLELNIDNIAEIDVLMLGLYVEETLLALHKYVPLLKPGTIIMDTAGNKTEICNQMTILKAERPDLHFFGCHPMAGKTFDGVRHSSAILFDKAPLLVVPISSDIEAITKLKKLMLSIGFDRFLITTAQVHDKMIAYTSQLAHIISSSYVKSPEALAHSGFSAGSFKDLTRVAKLNPNMWTELMLGNSANLIPTIELTINNLKEYLLALKTNNQKMLFQLLEDGTKIKQIVDNLKTASED